MIHDQKTVYGSWVTSIWLMEDLVERIVRWKIHPEDLVTNRFPLEKADEAYALMASDSPLTAGLLRPYPPDSKLHPHKRTQLDRFVSKSRRRSR